ncbi:FAD-dependent oxidoreductase [Pseudonocardia sp. RS010]|uniref:FAD-dependent oxidoreductase n=1 Tax=Pseudonocardia sp. RS010 TaxID=3385979 RepID=UPI0039A27993
MPTPLRHVAVVGAGPSGIFAAAELVKRPDLHVDVFDRLPTPFGLVRYGVAPDHITIKRVAAALTRTLTHPRVRFVGNVTVGTDVTLDRLRGAYDRVLVATGAPHARELGIPGEDLPGVYSAADLVSWYNGHPLGGIGFTTDTDSVAVVGAGNVSLDVARVLLKGGAGLAETDVPDPVLAALDRRPVRDVHIIVRRSVADVKFSPPELAEFERIDDLDLVVDPEQLSLGPDALARYGSDRTVAARVDTFRSWAARPHTGAGRRLHVHFLRSPVEVLGTGSVEALLLQVTAVGPAGRVATSRSETLPVGAVVRSVGYRAAPLPGLPFDADQGLVPHAEGYVGDRTHVVGWVKRGPSGVIGTNKACAIDSVRVLLAALDADPARIDGAERTALLAELAEVEVTWPGWIAIDDAEQARGAASGRVRTKITDVAEMVAIARSSC